MPQVSVIIPTYNYARFLGPAIASVLEQTFHDFELIVVDDGSTDETPEEVRAFMTDGRVRYLRQSNRGDASARNTGIRNSTGPYLAFLDSDDIWMPQKLERQLAVFYGDSVVQVVHSSVYLDQLDENQRLVSRSLLRRPPLRERTVYEELLYRNVITGSHSSVMMKRELLDEVGLFDEDFHICDLDLWRRISMRHEFHYIDEPLTSIRKHDANLSSNPDLMADDFDRYIQKLERDIPEALRYQLPRVRAARYLSSSYQFARRGRWSSAAWFAVKALPSALRCPLFTLRVLSGKLADRTIPTVVECSEPLASANRPDRLGLHIQRLHSR